MLGVVEATVLLALACGDVSPQAQPGASPPAIVTDERGWPVATELPAAAADDPGGVDRRPPPPSADAAAALSPMWPSVGTPQEAAALAGVSQRLRVTVLDERGAVVGDREIVHEAEMQAPDRDRLLAEEGARVYGRDGASAFATYRRLTFPAWEQEARDELAVFGWIARAPWTFADPARWRVLAHGPATWRGQELVRVRLRAAAAGVAPGDGGDTECEIWREQHGEPRFLRWRIGADGRWTTLRLLDWQVVRGAVRMPTRLQVEDDDGRRRLVFEVVTRTAGISWPPRHFAPPPR